MTKEVLIKYMDGHAFSMLIQDDEETKNFVNSINDGEFYNDPKTNNGFWTPIDKVRYLETRELNEQIERENQPRTEAIQRKKEINTDRKRTAKLPRKQIL